MRYWTFKHKPGNDANEFAANEFVKKAIKLNSALMQYEYSLQGSAKVTQNWQSIQNIKEGDWIFLRGDAKIYAVGKAIKPRLTATKILNITNILSASNHGEYLSGKFSGIIHFDDGQIFYEDLMSGKENDWGQRIDVQSWMYYYPQGIYAKSQEFYKAGSSEFGVSKELNDDSALSFLEQLKTKFMGEEIKVLLANKNVILTGAPGTGKTYLAKQMALKVIFAKDTEELLSDLEKEQFKKQYAFVQFHPSYDYTDFIEGLRPIKKNGQNEIGFELKNGIFKSFCCEAKNAWDIDKDKSVDEQRKFVFVIDEINRGEISKIFGELFFAIDPGYRGTKGKIKTQYHNINADVDFVDKKPESEGCFYIPENVYIIGTMNDIDRSVESFDFAMRRRFAWIEIKPEDRISMFDGQIDNYIVEAKAKMTALNIIIKEKLGGHFQIGPAYFLKLEPTNYNGDFVKLWNYHLEILLQEYLRGFSDATTVLDNLKNAYYGTH